MCIFVRELEVLAIAKIVLSIEYPLREASCLLSAEMLVCKLMARCAGLDLLHRATEPQRHVFV